MAKWNIRNRILVLTLFPAIAIALVLGLAFTQTRISSLQQLFQERGSSLSRQLASACEYGVFTENLRLLINLSNSTLDEKDVISVSVFNSHHERLAHIGPPSSLVIPFSTYPVKKVKRVDGAKSSIFVAPIHLRSLLLDEPETLKHIPRLQSEHHDDVNGWVIIQMTRKNLNNAIHQTLITSGTLISLGILINWLIALRMSRGVVRPIVDITHAVTDIRNNKLDTRIYTDGGEELKQLEDGINSMAEALSKAQDEMQNSINQATEDLRETLETIEIQNIELDIARKEALEASRIKSEFLANMSHEIRTPLNGILGFTDLLLKGQLTPMQADHLSTIKKSSEILLTIINDILDFSKIEAGKLSLDHSPIQLRCIIEDVMTMLAPAAHAKFLDLVPLVYADVPNNILGDELRLKQIITNLLNNAIKFTQSGEVILRAMIEDEKEDQVEIKISITDSGVGLSRIQQQTLFNAFAQADASTARQYGGTGLGLAISKRLVEEMGGKIGLHSELGKGSTFWFSLVTHTCEAYQENELSPFKGERLIYLENQPATQLSVLHKLKAWNLNVTVVNSSTELITSVVAAQKQQKGFSAVVLGINKHLLASSLYRQLVDDLEYRRNCRTLLLTPTLENENPELLNRVSAHTTKPVVSRRLHGLLNQLIYGTLYEDIQTTMQPRPSSSGLENACILAVDDNEANLKLVSTLLKDLGVKIDTANSGFEALKKSRKNKYDLIFMDVQMPGMDGIETTVQLRSEEKKGQYIPVIALTAHALEDEKTQLLSSGFNDYLTKPVNENDLLKMIIKHTSFNSTSTKTEANNNESNLLSSHPKNRRPSSKSTEPACVDIPTCIKLAAGKSDLAEELFSMLLESLIGEQSAMQSLYDAEDLEPLLERVHKLHGATKYCGVPALRIAADKMEHHLKQVLRDDQERYILNNSFEQLSRAIIDVQEWSDHHDWQSMIRAV